jgi:sugar O-acyltransferase (sialic acid O-acetyltransferase NeuD family)
MFDDFERKGATKYNKPILGKISDIPNVFERRAFDSVAIAIGYKHMKFRKEVYDYLKRNIIPIVTFIHPSSYVEKSAAIKEGCIVLVSCTVDMNAVLEKNVFLSSRSFVSHNVTIGAHTYCGPSVNLAGNTEVGECCFLGINTTTIENIRIGTNVQTGAGSVVTKDIPTNILVAGVPAVFRKEVPGW